MKKIAVLFHDGFEELEALSVVDVMRRAKIECTMVGSIIPAFSNTIGPAQIAPIILLASLNF